MREDLIERINARLSLMAAPPEWADKPVYVDAEPVRTLLREAADALEAAREDAEKWRQAFVIERARLYCKQGMKVEQSLIHAETDATVAAIDQARGKAGGEVEGG